MDVVNAGYDARLLVVPAADNAIRLLPPLNITDAEIDEAMARLDAACVAVEAAQGEAAGGRGTSSTSTRSPPRRSRASSPTPARSRTRGRGGPRACATTTCP